MNQDIQIHDKQFSLFIPSEYIDMEVQSLAHKLKKDYAEINPVFIVILNGAFMFAADLFKHYTETCDITFLKLSSYDGTTSTGKVSYENHIAIDLKGRNVIIVEDIVDTGLTIQELKKHLATLSPKSVEVCTLLFKPEAFRGDDPPKYQGFVIANKFVLGYGLDYNERGRNLKDLYQLKD